jgi:Peptidase family M41
MGEAMGVEQLPTPTVADIGIFVVTKLGYCGYALILPCFLQPWLHVLSAPHHTGYLMTRTELLDRLAVLLGGRTAEELIFGDVSTGAQDDLQRVTDLVRHMITRYGMSEALGLATFEVPRQALFLQVPAGGAKDYSEDTARVIDTEIHQVLDPAGPGGRAHAGSGNVNGEAGRLRVACQAPHHARGGGPAGARPAAGDARTGGRCVCTSGGVCNRRDGSEVNQGRSG